MPEIVPPSSKIFCQSEFLNKLVMTILWRRQLGGCHKCLRHELLAEGECLGQEKMKRGPAAVVTKFQALNYNETELSF